MKGFQNIEDQLLDDIEQSSRRLYHKSKFLNEETNTQNKLITQIDTGIDSSTEAMNKQARHAELATQLTKNDCWLYSVIVIESVVLFLLIYIGLS
mmetsp:Transcript_7758/g.6928  ORF Transcript_7758/g.6928 Transcript_7758/m.6928 type:complete len:95 (-) Transcript_7758:3-287(-)